MVIWNCQKNKLYKLILDSLPHYNIECFLFWWIRNIYKKWPSHTLKHGSQKQNKSWGTEEEHFSFEGSQKRLDRAHMDVTSFVHLWIFVHKHKYFIKFASSNDSISFSRVQAVQQSCPLWQALQISYFTFYMKRRQQSYYSQEIFLQRQSSRQHS